MASTFMWIIDTAFNIFLHIANEKRESMNIHGEKYTYSAVHHVPKLCKSLRSPHIFFISGFALPFLCQAVSACPLTLLPRTALPHFSGLRGEKAK